MINIYHITHTDIKNDWRIRKEIQALSKIRDYNVVGVGLDFFSKLEFPDDNISTLNIKRIVSRYKLLNFLFTFWSMVKLTLFLFKVNKIDVVHCHDTPSLAVGYVYKLLNPKVVLIYDAHELESQKGGQLKIFSLITKFIEVFCTPEVDGFITVSYSILDYYKMRFGFLNGITVFNAPNYLNSSKVEDLRLINNIPLDSELFIHVGLLNRGRGIEDLLKTFSKDVNHSKYIFFFGFGELESEILTFSAEHKNIVLFGNVDNFKLNSYIAQFDYGLCTIKNDSVSDFLSLPNKFFEYINANVTTISSDFPELSRVTSKLNCGYVTSDICSFINSNRYKKLNYTCSDEFTWNAQANKLLGLYDNLLRKQVTDHT